MRGCHCLTCFRNGESSYQRVRALEIHNAREISSRSRAGKTVLERRGDLSLQYSRASNLPSLARTNSLVLFRSPAHAFSSSRSLLHQLSLTCSPTLYFTVSRALFPQFANALLEFSSALSLASALSPFTVRVKLVNADSNCT